MSPYPPQPSHDLPEDPQQKQTVKDISNAKGDGPADGTQYRRIAFVKCSTVKTFNKICVSGKNMDEQT